MNFPRRFAMALVLLGGLETAGIACVTFTEAKRIADADVVVDGIAVCNSAKGICRLRARRIVKDRLRGNSGPAAYRLHYDPRATERLEREMERTGEIQMCLVPWEPRSARVEGRFYLDRRRGRLFIRQDSARGPEPVDEVRERTE